MTIHTVIIARYTHTSQLVKARAYNPLSQDSPSTFTSLPSMSSSQAPYSLKAVVVHSGGIHSGHYVTYRKGPMESKSATKWFYTSDSTVKQVPFSEVLVIFSIYSICSSPSVVFLFSHHLLLLLSACFSFCLSSTFICFSSFSLYFSFYVSSCFSPCFIT